MRADQEPFYSKEIYYIISNVEFKAAWSKFSSKITLDSLGLPTLEVGVFLPQME